MTRKTQRCSLEASNGTEPYLPFCAQQWPQVLVAAIKKEIQIWMIPSVTVFLKWENTPR